MNPLETNIALTVGVVTAIATLAGGALALRFQSAIGTLFGFSSGAVLGVGLLDLLPEALNLGRVSHTPMTIMTAVICGFALFMLIDRLSEWSLGPKEGRESHLGPASLTVHSLMDGLGIGLAFMVSSAAGLIVALAVIAHDLLDGANTVALSLASGNTQPAARKWLVADAIAPLAGIGIAKLINVPPELLALFLALFAGCFLYMGAVELLGRSRQANDGLSNVAATLCGIAFIYGVVSVAM